MILTYIAIFINALAVFMLAVTDSSPFRDTLMFVNVSLFIINLVVAITHFITTGTLL